MDPNLIDILTRVRVLPDLVDLLPSGQELYLVGGTLRDHLLGRPLGDFDFAVSGDPTLLAREFARRVGGHWFFLDEERRQSRVTARGGGELLTYDFAPFRAPDIEGDLRLRDFTVNALAVPLHQGGGELFDPLGGMEDLGAKLLRGCSPGVFTDDPLRVLKGVRHAAVLGFDIEENTAAWMRAAALGIERIAPERIRAEIGAIFYAEPIASALLLMQSLNCLEPLFGFCEGTSDFKEGVRLAERCETVLQTLALAPQERRLVNEEIEGGVSRAALLKTAAFGIGYAGAGIGCWSEKLKLGRRGGAIMDALARLDPGKAREIEDLPPGRPRALWTAALGRTPVEPLIFLAVLDTVDEAKAAEIVRPVLRDWLRHLEGDRVPDLIDGEEIREILGLAPGPAVGEALDTVRREEIAGRVKTPEEGRIFLKSQAKKWIDNP